MKLLEADPEYNLQQLVSVADSISVLEGQGQDNDAQERQRKLSSVLQKVIQSNEFVTPLFQLMIEKIQSIGETLLNSSSEDAKSGLINSTTQLVWLIEFIIDKEPKIASTIIPQIVNNLEKLWIHADKVLTTLEVEGKSIDNVINTVCPVIRMYHRIVQSSINSEEDQITFLTKFQFFMNSHHEILWKIIESKPHLLVDDLDFALFTPAKQWNRSKLNQLMTFKQQKEWLAKQLEESHRKHSSENITITVKRGDLGEQSCSSLMVGEGSLFKGKFNVIFEGEEGSGAGVRREWFAETSKEIFNPNNALFLLCHDGTLQPNPASSIHLDHLSYFKFAGRLIGLAIYHSVR